MKIENTVYNNLSVREFSPSKEINGVIIAIHGFAGDKDSSVITSLAKEMCKYNYTLITFDLPNHGENDSSNVLSLDNCFNALKDIDLLVKEKYSDKKISYFATSFGGYLLLNMLKDSGYKYDKIILRAPAINMDKILKEVIIVEHGYDLKQLENNSINLGYAKELLIDYKFYNDLKDNKLMNNYKNNNYLYVIQGRKDDVVNYKDNELFFKEKCLNNYEIHYFENADHRFKNEGELEKIIEITKEIILEK